MRIFRSVWQMILIPLWIHGINAAFLQGPSVVTYWGQNSAGATDSGGQKNLAAYCDGSSDAIIMAFINQFNVGGLPNLNLANACQGSFFQSTKLLSCPQVADDIKTCQSKGIKILLSLGGASGAYGFSNDDDGVTFANTLWNLFGNGKSDTRPFGDAILDGFDLDIEGGGSTGYVAFVNQLRKLYASDTSKTYYITAAPQCPFPDAILGSVISDASFDAVNVQFYNNYCAATSGSSFNFGTWDHWAKSGSPNRNVKVLLGIPGSPTAAGSGYVPFSQLTNIVQSISGQYSSYGGVTVWDASQSYSNTEVSPNYAAALAGLVHGSGAVPSSPASSAVSSSVTPTSSSAVSNTSSSAVPTTPSSFCDNHYGSCSTENQFVCAAQGTYAVCDHGKWTLSSCPPGTSCFSTTDGESIYCGFATTTTTTNTTGTPSSPGTCISHPNVNSVPRTLHSTVAAELFIDYVSGDRKTFRALINARRLDSRPFGSSVVVEMTAPPSINITGTQQGITQQTGRTVRMQIKNAYKKSMAMIIMLDGGVTNSSMLVAPDATRLKFLS